MIDRRRFLTVAALPVLGVATGAYAIGVEPNFLMRIKRYALTPPNWPSDFRLRLAVI
jgi:hypothetical protein